MENAAGAVLIKNQFFLMKLLLHNGLFSRMICVFWAWSILGMILSGHGRSGQSHF
jgi:hypothetical protein